MTRFYRSRLARRRTISLTRSVSLLPISVNCRLTRLRLSKLALNGNKSHLAFGLDSGVVGLVELGKKEVKNLQQKHANVSTTKILSLIRIPHPTRHRSAAPSSSSLTEEMSWSQVDMTTLSNTSTLSRTNSSLGSKWVRSATSLRSYI